MAGYLLLPDDELTLVTHLLEVESLTRLAHDDLAHGPQVAGALRTSLPLPDGPDAGRFVFWASGVGDLVGEATGSFLDYTRSPVVVWDRSRWHRSGALCPGRISSQRRRRDEQPPALLALYDRVQAWMKKQAVKLPRDEHGTIVRAFPHAAQWVREGGPVYSAPD